MDQIRAKLLELGFVEKHTDKGRKFRHGRLAVSVSTVDTTVFAEACPDGKMQWQTVELEIRNNRGCLATNYFTVERASDARSIKFEVQAGLDWFLAKVEALDTLVN